MTCQIILVSRKKKWGKISSPKDGHVYFSNDSWGLGSSNRGLSGSALVLPQQRCVGGCGRVPVVTEMAWRKSSETGNQKEHICLGSGRNVPVLCMLYIWGLVRDVTQIVVTVPQLGQTRDKTNQREVCFVFPQARVCYHREGKSWWTLEKAGKQKTRDVHVQPMLTVKMGLPTPANSPNLGTPSEACLPS